MFLFWFLLWFLSALTNPFECNALRSKSDLSSHCYHFPAMDFGYGNNVKYTYKTSPKVLLSVGSEAIDFSLSTDEGKPVSLSVLLKSKPVVLIWGHYTCPAWQGLNSDVLFPFSSHQNESAFVEAVKNTIHVLHIVSLEPHPSWPHANFDSGYVRMNLWSTIAQPQSYAERAAVSVPPVKRLLHEDALLLVDSLDGVSGKYNNPVWCTYANGARSAVFVTMDGLVAYTQDWFNGPDLLENVSRILRL